MVGRSSMISKTRVMAPVPSRNWPYRPAMDPRLAPIATPYRRNAVSVSIPSVPSMTWWPVYQSSTAIAPKPRKPINAPNRRPPEGQTRARGDGAPQVDVVALELPLLADVALDDADAGQRLLGGRRAARDRVLDLGADALERPAEHDRDDDQRRRQQQHDEQQRRAEREQDDDRAHEADDRRQQLRDGLREHRPDDRHVVGQARDELADPMAGMEVERQRHQPPEQLAAQLGDHPLPHHAEQVRLQERAERLHAEQQEQHEDEPVQARRVAAGDDRAGDPGDDEREQQAQRRRQHESHEGDRERQPVRAQVAKQAAPRHAAETADLANHGARVGRHARELLAHGRWLMSGSVPLHCGARVKASWRSDVDIPPMMSGVRDCCP